MDTENMRQGTCAEVEDRMAEILEGTAPDALLDHIAECDVCRDARYDAERARDIVQKSGADHVPLDDLESRVLAALDRRTGNPGIATPQPDTDRQFSSATPAASAEASSPADSGERNLTQRVDPQLGYAPTLPSSPPRSNMTEIMDREPHTARGVGPTQASEGVEVERPNQTVRITPELQAQKPTTEAMPEAPAAPELPLPAPVPAPAPTIEQPAARQPEPVHARPRLPVLSKGKLRWIAGGGIAAMLAVATGGVLLIRAHYKKKAEVADTAGWHGKVDKIASATGKTAGGLQVCSPDGKSCSDLSESATIPAGSVLVTDAHTRARLTLNDGTELSLDHGTRFALSSDESARRAKLESGSVVLDVAKVEGKNARIDLPRGWVGVLGTKLSLHATPDSSTVAVSRGSVKLWDPEGRWVTVRAGEEGRSYAGTPPFVSAAPQLGESIAWSESAQAEGEQEVAVRGLGELKAKKPGDKTERDNAVSLTGHSVKVRIAGAMARTEVDETFTNNTDEVLEGIYRFPIPPDAKIERLALEVDGKMEEGAFVDRDRAAAIWRGAIVNSAPQLRQQVREEIVWVPGPWRDPALLEWQRGGRFELRIFPIPKKGSRRVILAYTQVIKPTGGVRRFSYPLAHDPSGSTRVGKFDVDVQVRGHDEAFGVRTQGYDLAKSKAAGADQLTLSASSFVPSGDLVVEYALPNRDAELTAWAYKPTGEEAKAAAEKAAKEAAKVAAKETVAAKVVVNPKAAKPVEAPKVAADAPYVAISLRPKLPRSREGGKRNFAIVVDSSRSMFGESYKRATQVASKLIREIDRGDSFILLACDAGCRLMPGGQQIPSAQAALEAKRWLEGITPEGASDPTAAVRQAQQAAGDAKSDVRVVFIGDGTPTVGAIRQAYVSRAIERDLPPGRGSVTTVAVGADSDADTLGAMARGGGGVMLPFVPGQTTAEAVYAVLGATYGTTLREATVELPAGLTEVAPTKLGTFVSGGEELVVARMDRSNVEGTVVVRGKLGKESFEQKYPVKIVASEAKGNAFVPRLFAATRIQELERTPDPNAKKEAIRLSSAFDVASRFTSLLVLESEAMNKAFGLDTTRSEHQWTGEETATSATATGEIALDEEAEDDAYAAKDKASAPGGGLSQLEGGGGDVSGGFGVGTKGSGRASTPPPAKAAPSMPAAEPAAPSFSDAPAEEKAKKEAPRTTASGSANRGPSLARRRPPRDDWGGGRRMIPMRRIFERKGVISEGRLIPKVASASTIAAAERDVEQNANRREATKKLFTLYAIAGDLERARSTAERWSEKEPLDAEALTARADVAARAGDRDLAIRVLGSVVDVRPDDVASQKRLARLERWAGRAADGCRHTLAIAQLRGGDASLLAEAASCGRRTGESAMVEDMLAAADPRVKKAAEPLIVKFDKQSDELSGDIKLEATWFGGDQDLDIALIDPDGNRVSWLGAPTKAVISASDVVSTSREGLALRGGKAGEYVVEVVRGTNGGGPVRGEVVITVAGTKKTVPFTLTGTRETVGIAAVTIQSRLVPINTGFWGE
jgi:hypothetical protein